MTMFLGATSKVILANLPDHTLKSIYLNNEKTIKKTLKVPDWKSFREQFRNIKRACCALTDSEAAKGRIGLAAPISRGDQIIAGISLVSIPRKTSDTTRKEYIASVKGSAAAISEALSNEQHVVSR